MSIFDFALDFAEALLSGGIPGRTTLKGQRRARFVIGAVTFVLGLFLWESPTPAVTTAAVIFVLGNLIASGWVFVFSIVDLTKIKRALPLSMAAAVISAAALGLAVHAASRMSAGAA